MQGGRGDNPIHYKKGYHRPGLSSAFGAAAACGKVLHLSEQGDAGTLGIVASMSGASGNFADNDQTSSLLAGQQKMVWCLPHLAQLGLPLIRMSWKIPGDTSNPRRWF